MAHSSSTKSTGSTQPDYAMARPAVLVTGASGGIGRAISRSFGAIGWHVGVHYSLNKPEAEATLQQIKTHGGSGHLYQADIRKWDSVQQMIDSWRSRVPTTAAFICNAGIAESSLLMRQSERVWDEVIETNLTGTFHCLRAMAPVLLAGGGGSIIVIGSHTGFHGASGQTAYATSKAGLIGLVKSAAWEWGARNVRVNLLLPGWQKTGLTADIYPERGEWSDHSLRHPPSLEEAARTVVYLAQLHGVSGQVWNCDSRNL